MFAVSEAEAAQIRTTYERDGAFMAVMEVRRLFPGIRDNAEALRCAQTIASWAAVPTDRPD